MLDTLLIIDSNDIDTIRFLSVLAGQSIKFNTKCSILYNSNLKDYIINFISFYENHDSIETIITKFKNNIDGYIKYENDIYKSINSISLDDRFILLCMNKYQENILNQLGIQKIIPRKIYTYDTKSIIYQDPKKNPSGLIDIAIIYRIKMSWKKFPIFYDIGLRNLWGWSDTICGCIPLEYCMVSQLTNKCGYVYPTDSFDNLGLLLSINNRINITKLKINKIKIDTNKYHLISWVYTDGDNFRVPYHRMYYYLNSQRNFPITWTIPLTAPKILLKRVFEKAPIYDEFIAGPSGYGYCFPNKFPCIREHYSRTDKLLNEYSIEIVNEIHKNDFDGMCNLLGYFGNCQHCCKYNTHNYAKNECYSNANILLYDAWNYTLNQNPQYGANNNKIFFANKSLYFDNDLSKILNLNYNNTDYSIIPVNLWKYDIDKLIDISNKLSNKYPNIKFVNLSTLMHNIYF